jgi:hypothetical protein
MAKIKVVFNSTHGYLYKNGQRSDIYRAFYDWHNSQNSSYFIVVDGSDLNSLTIYFDNIKFRQGVENYEYSISEEENLQLFQSHQFSYTIQKT